MHHGIKNCRCETVVQSTVEGNAAAPHHRHSVEGRYGQEPMDKWYLRLLPPEVCLHASMMQVVTRWMVRESGCLALPEPMVLAFCPKSVRQYFEFYDL